MEGFALFAEVEELAVGAEEDVAGEGFSEPETTTLVLPGVRRAVILTQLAWSPWAWVMRRILTSWKRIVRSPMLFWRDRRLEFSGKSWGCSGYAEGVGFRGQ